MKAFFSAVTRRILDLESGIYLLLVATVWLLATAGLRPLMLPDEGRYVGIAWEMLGSGDWLVPTLDGMPFFHKPPLFYWLTALGLQIFGVNEWAGRIASTFSALLATGVVFLFIRKHAGKSLANLSVVVLITQPFFFVGAQFANLDMLVAAMITITIIAGADAVLNLERGLPYRTALTVCYGFAALGVLAKGLIGFVLPGAILLVWLLVRGKYRLIPALLPPYLIAFFLVLAAPWFIWMEKSFDGFWDYFFVYHHFRRFSETGFNNQQAFWFYIPLLLLCTLPWSPWVFRGLSPRLLKTVKDAPISGLMLLWTLGILIFFSLPKSKLVGYILPALPPFACLVAQQIHGWLRSGKNDNAAAWIGASTIGAGVFCMAIVIGTSRFDPSGLQQLAPTVGKTGGENDQIVMINEYEYDLPFYFRAKKNPWVVGDWDNPEISKLDNWRKELHDAGQFKPGKMAETLISQNEFLSRLCAHPETTYWIWGNKDFVIARYPFADEKSIAFSFGKKALWRLTATAIQSFDWCREMPRND